MAGNTLLLSEVLDLVAKAKTKEKKIQNPYCIIMEPTNDYSSVEVGGRGYVYFVLKGKLKTLMNGLYNEAVDLELQ